MFNINWDNFGLKNQSKQSSLEDLCIHLFCRELKVERIDAYVNQVGIETEPISINKKLYGIQVKFFQGKFDWDQVSDSVIKAIKNYPDLDFIYVFSNQNRTLNRSKKTTTELKLEKVSAKHGIEIKYITSTNIRQQLVLPSNLDIAQLYFDVGDELGFIRNSVNPSVLTYIQSSNYLDLPFNPMGNTISNVSLEIIASSDKAILLTGHPGSGKSICMHKLLQIYGGLNQSSVKEMKRILMNNNAIPILINLKNCTDDSLETLITNRQSVYSVSNKSFKFVYLLDGLDELNEQRVEFILSQIQELSNKHDTKKIIISCRLGSLNKIKAKNYLKDYKEYSIAKLEKHHIDLYFQNNYVLTKNDLLNKIKVQNVRLIESISDILILKLFWETIENLTEESTIIDLIGYKISSMLQNPLHKKNIEELNLLNPKLDQILLINRSLSFIFQKKFQFRFTQIEIQQHLQTLLPKLDYKSVNSILNYLSELFFDNSVMESTNAQTYIYQHRRYQEYFFLLALKEEYEIHPKILRELNILPNYDLFQNLFIKYLRKEYVANENLIGNIEINLLKVYLGRNEDWGADEPYFYNADNFIPALSLQTSESFDELLAHESINLKNIFFVDSNLIREKLERYQQGDHDPELKYFIRRVWESNISKSLKNIRLFSENNQKDFANDLFSNFEVVYNLVKDNKAVKSIRKSDAKRKDPWIDPFWNDLESLIYLRMIIKGESVDSIYKNIIKKFSNTFSDVRPYPTAISPREKMIRSFIDISIRNKLTEFVSVLSEFNNQEFICLIDEISSIDSLHIIFQSNDLLLKIKDHITNFKEPINKSNINILFFKKILGVKIKAKEQKILDSEMNTIKSERKFDMTMHNLQIKYAMYKFNLNLHNYDDSSSELRYYDELELFCLIFKEYVHLLMSKRTLEEIFRDFVKYSEQHYHGSFYGQYLINDITRLWVHIFERSILDPKLLRFLINRLFNIKQSIDPFIFQIQLRQLNSNLFYKLFDKSDFEDLEQSLNDWNDDYPSYIKRCFDLSILFSNIDKIKALNYFIKGINDGILRHGWHKDGIVSYDLTDAVEILWENNWETKENLIKLTDKVFELTLRVNEITDGSGTWSGPYNIITMVSKYDIEQAVKYKNLLIERKGKRNFNVSVITTILLSKAHAGYSIEEIEEGMNEYPVRYDYQGKDESESYEGKFAVYLAIANSLLYSDIDRRKAFDQAYKQVEFLKDNGIKYYIRDNDYKDEKLLFQKLCNKYEREFVLDFEEAVRSNTQESAYDSSKVIDKINSINNKMGLKKLYKELEDYNMEFKISEKEAYISLINKTYEITSSIKSFIKYVKGRGYPHYDWSRNSNFKHAIAYCLSNINLRKEMFDYLYYNSGHQGFINIMKVYEVNGNKDMCLKMFDRFYKFCELLVN